MEAAAEREKQKAAERAQKEEEKRIKSEAKYAEKKEEDEKTAARELKNVTKEQAGMADGDQQVKRPNVNLTTKKRERELLYVPLPELRMG